MRSASPQQLEHLPPQTLTPHPSNPRTHAASQIRRTAGSIRALGFRD